MAECLTLTETELDELRESAPGASARQAGDEAFRLPWELRGFAIGVATFERGTFEWPEFQGALIGAIDGAEEEGRSEQYYARWVEAYEELVLDRVGIDPAELDAKTREVLATPRDATHQHPRDEPIAHDHGHGHDHSDDHGHHH